MNQQKFSILAGAAVVVLAAGVWISLHRSSQQSETPRGPVFADLAASLGDITEIRFSKGDGSRTTLRKSGDAWTIVERQYPADSARVREIALGLANLKIVESKTRDPANYAKIGVEPADKPAAASTLVEVVAGPKTWSLLVGKGADGRAVYVRKPTEAASGLAEPFIAVDPDQKRWIDRLLTDLPAASVHDIAVKPANAAPYLLARATRGAEFVLTPVPKGRVAATAMSLGSQADALAGFHFDDVRALPSPAIAPSDVATYRTFDGQVIVFSGHREADKALITVNVSRDAALAAQFPDAKPAPAAPAPAAATQPKPADQTVEKLAARVNGVEYEIPAYKYEAIFKKPEDLLEKLPEPVNKTPGKKPALPIKKAG